MSVQESSPVIDPFAPEASDPMPCFRAWFAEAEASEPNDPNAMALATASASGAPSVRMVLLKEVEDSAEFVFYTNAESSKGEEIRANPQAAVCLHWKSLRRQIRIDGTLSEVSPERADRYFHSRSRKSQISAAVSEQSRPLNDRAALEQASLDLAARYPARYRGRHTGPASHCAHCGSSFGKTGRIAFTIACSTRAKRECGSGRVSIRKSSCCPSCVW